MRTTLRGIIVASVILTALSLVLPAHAQGFAKGTRVAVLNGGNEVPGPGDPDGEGFASIHVRPRLGRLCFVLFAQDITLPAAAAHVHRGAAGVAGPIRVTLEAPDADGESAGCVNDVRERLLRRIKQTPRNFYVNIHTTDFPDGAIRGQLHRP